MPARDLYHGAVVCDNTDLVVAEDLVTGGVPRDAIVLGFRAPEVRPYTGFATG